MTDLEFGISNAGMKVWPSSKWNLCWFHVRMNSSDKMDSLKVPHSIQNILRNEVSGIHKQTKQEGALSLWKAFLPGVDFLKDSQVSTNPMRLSISNWFAVYHDFFLSELGSFRIEYFEVHYMSKVHCWITHEELDATNNLVERFNLHIQAVLFQGHTFNKGINVIEKFGEVLQIQELHLLPVILWNQRYLFKDIN